MSAQPPASSASVSENGNRRRNRSDYLKPLHDEWDRNPGQMPSSEVRRALQAEVQKISGTKYPMTNLKSFFSTRLAKLRSQGRDLRFPSLSKQATEYVDLLLKSSSNADPEILEIFSSLIIKAYPGCTAQDIAGYISHAQADQQRFPTPASVLSSGSDPSSPALKFQPPVLINNTTPAPQNVGSATYAKWQESANRPVYGANVTSSPPPPPPPISAHCITFNSAPPPNIINYEYTHSTSPADNHSEEETELDAGMDGVIQPPIKAEYSSPPSPSNHLRTGDTISEDTNRRRSLIKLIIDGVDEAIHQQTAPTTPSSAPELEVMFSRIEKLSHYFPDQQTYESHALHEHSTQQSPTDMI